MNAAPPKLKPTLGQSLVATEALTDGLERRRELGQFFTSPEVAGFIWDLLEVIHGRRFYSNTRLIDPACGEGVFLRVANERGGLPATSLFGADVDEALAPGWRQDPLLRDAHVVVANGLLSQRAPTELFTATALFDRRRPTASDYQQAAQLIGHWPENRPLDISRPEVRDTIRRLASTAIEVMFTERFVRLAKRGGLIAVIVPESIVASDRLGQFRIWLLGRMDLLASVSLPQKVFTGVGANAKTSIVFARRRARDRPDGWYSPDALDNLPQEDCPIFMAAPRLDVPGFSVESYLTRVLADAQRQRDTFWPDAK